MVLSKIEKFWASKTRLDNYPIKFDLVIKNVYKNAKKKFSNAALELELFWVFHKFIGATYFRRNQYSFIFDYHFILSKNDLVKFSHFEVNDINLIHSNISTDIIEPVLNN